MKLALFFSAAALALSVSSTPVEVPARSGVYPDLGMIHSSRAPSRILQDRAEANCLVFNPRQVVKTLGTSIGVAFAANFGGKTAQYVCQKLGDTESNCTVLKDQVWYGIALIGYIGTSGKIGAFPAGDEPVKRSVSHTEHISSALAGAGYLVDHVQDATSSILSKRDGQGNDLPQAITSIRGLRRTNESQPHDFQILHWDDGRGQIHIPMPGASSNGQLLRRDQLWKAPGFKISYTTRLPSQLSDQHKEDMAGAIADYWHSLISLQMHDLIGFVETGHKANWYYRIIPETVNFGLNYEDVNACGQMAGAL